MQDERDEALESALIDDEGRFQRFAGLHTYGDHPLDSALFMGRDVEAKSLEYRIRAERCLVLFGRSGLGKSSLLKAAVFPALRAQHFFPFIIRLDENIKDPQRAVIDALEDACSRNPEVDLIGGDSSFGLWLFFRTSDIWYGDGVMTPVLVFDQFEEIFTDQDEEFRATFARQLRELLENAPARLIHRLREEGKTGNFQADAKVDVRVVFSLREEYLAELEELVVWLPSLLDQRFRLLPMGRANAEQAICQPAQMGAKHALERLHRLGANVHGAAAERLGGLLDRTVRFRLTDGSKGKDDALSTLLDILVDSQNQIDLTMLQTICRDIEERVEQIAKTDAVFLVDTEFLGSKKQLLAVWHRYYQNALDVVLDRYRQQPERGSVSPRGSHIERRKGLRAGFVRAVIHLIPGNQRRKARKLCEVGLLSEEGNRLSLAEERAKRRFGIEDTTLSLLQRNRLVRKDRRTGLKGYYYELSHDRLADVVYAERGRNMGRHRVIQMAMTAAAIVAFLLGGFFSRESYERVERVRNALEESSAAVQTVTNIVQTSFFRNNTSETPQVNAEALRKLGMALDQLESVAGKEPGTDPGSPVPKVSPGDGAKPLRDRFLEDGVGQGPRLVKIPSGTFEMGANSGGPANEQPQYSVAIGYQFHFSEYEVSREEFARFANSEASGGEGRKGCLTMSDGVWRFQSEASWRNPGFKQEDDHPVVCVSWQEARDYADWLSRKTGHCYRLPSEAEWEYAARAGTDTRFWWGDRMRQKQANCVTCGSEWSGRGTAPVGSFAANPFGLYDTSGNVFEWVADCYHPNYQGAPADGSARHPEPGNTCDLRVVRGGAWLLGSDAMRSAFRQQVKASERSGLVGIRLVRVEGACPKR